MIKSTIKNNQPLIKYPILKINSSKTIVLFSDESTGMVIHSETGFYKTGYFQKDWSEIGFIRFTDSITIKNDRS